MTPWKILDCAAAAAVITAWCAVPVAGPYALGLLGAGAGRAWRALRRKGHRP